MTKWESDLEDFKTKCTAYEARIEDNAKVFEKTDTQRQRAFDDTDTRRQKEIKALQMTIADLSRENENLTNSNQQLVTENAQLKLSMNTLRHENLTLKAESSRKDAEVCTKGRILEENDSIISGMSEQLTRARQYLSSSHQVSILL